MSSASMVVEAPAGASPDVATRGSALVDPALVLRAQAGDPDALTALAEQVRPTAQRFASRFLGDPTRGEDVAQVALMKAFSRLGDVRAPAAFPAWLMRIVRNECLNELSCEKHAQVPMSLLADEGTQIQAPAGGADDPEEALLRSQLQDLVRRVAATLPHHHRQALVMRALEDRTYEEISQALDVPVSVARVWYFRARKRFRTSFVTMMVARRGVPALCQEMGEAIAEMIEGTLAAADRPRLQGHLDSCGVCRQTEDELRNTAFRSPTRAMVLGLGLLRLGWRLPGRLRAGAAHAPAAAVKVAVTGAGGAVLATAIGAAAPPAAPAGSTLSAAATTATGTVDAAPPAYMVVTSPAPPAGATATPAPPTLPGLPAVLGAAPAGSLLEQLRGATTRVGGAVVAPLPTPSAGLGSVTSAVGGVAHPPTVRPGPALP